MGWEEHVKIMGKAVTVSLERGAHKADSESLFLFSDMDLDCCLTLLPKAGHCFKFTSQFSSPRTFQSLNLSWVSILWMVTEAGRWTQGLEQWALSPAAVLGREPRTSLMCHCTSPKVCNNPFLTYEKSAKPARAGEQENNNTGMCQNQLGI